MAHLASAFVGLWLVLLMPAFGRWGVVLIAIPVLMSVAIERMRTIADDDSVTARMMLGSRTLRWTDIEGLRFTKSRWARACRHGQADVVLPAVTFATRTCTVPATRHRACGCVMFASHVPRGVTST